MVFFILGPSIQHFKVDIIKKAAKNISGISIIKYQNFLLRCDTNIEGQVTEAFPISILLAERRTLLKRNSL